MCTIHMISKKTKIPHSQRVLVYGTFLTHFEFFERTFFDTLKMFYNVILEFFWNLIFLQAVLQTCRVSRAQAEQAQAVAAAQQQQATHQNHLHQQWNR